MSATDSEGSKTTAAVLKEIARKMSVAADLTGKGEAHLRRDPFRPFGLTETEKSWLAAGRAVRV
jgi:hypothetical protein